ncbi:MAG: LPS export ABC transporter periplasmic protein LptC [Alistipes sp.]|nr:LPS export ABC transporter periplasmic protein LptC [Alistipes sp.]
MFLRIKRYAVIALSVVGSATLLFSCGNKTQIISYDNETLMTESSENRTITMMENGKRSYTFTSPLMEGYRLATNPYQEFRRGIEMTTYTDSLSLPEVTITANYAIYYERQKLWEAKGNVVVIRRDREEGDTTVKGLTEVYTQQLFWNATTKKIYSNVDTKVLQADGWHFGVGFDADDDLKNIHFRRYSSEIEFDVRESEKSDTTKRKSLDERIKENKSASEKEGRKGMGAKTKRDGKANNRPAFATPKSLDENIVRPTDNLKPHSPMQIEGGSKRPIIPERDRRAGSKPVQSGSKQTPVGIKSSNMEVDTDVQISTTKQ